MAVLAVLAFHAGMTWVAGGLLGVDMFFVLSGFLVTSLLLAEHTRTGRLSLGRFWARRARRLLPALFIVLAGICAYARWVNSGLAPPRLRGDALGTLAYVANWHYVISGQDYFVRYGAPSPLLHTWSLAVEEQFYLVWPIVALVVLRRFGRPVLGWVAGSLAALSAGLCAVLWLSGASVGRLYYGTDTRAQAIMVGALLAVLLSFAPASAQPAGAAAAGPAGRHGRRHAPTRGLLGVGGLVAAGALALSLHAVNGDGPFLYLGGFLVVAMATATIVAVTVRRPGDLLSRALGWPPLRYTGRISYGLYLYHWPLFLVLNRARTGLTGGALLAVRLGVTFAAAGLSERFIERPIRTRARPGTALPLGTPRPRLTVPLATAGLTLVLVLGLVGVTASPGTAASASDRSGDPPGPGYRAAGGATAAHPQHAILIGDSMALTLGLGLRVDASAWGVSLDNDGALGCDLDPHTKVKVMGTVSQAAQGCPTWPGTWAGLVARSNPDVVAVLLGRWESLDRLYQGRWSHVGEPAFDTHLQTELGQIIEVAASHGARVAFLTLPYIAQTTAEANGSPWDMNLPSRTDAYNADVRAAVARHPGQAAVVDLNRMLDPDGHYASFRGGVRVRDTDDEHLSRAGGEWLRAALLPALAQLGAAHYLARAARARTSPTTTSAPSSTTPSQARSLARLKLAGQLMSGR